MVKFISKGKQFSILLASEKTMLVDGHLIHQPGINVVFHNHEAYVDDNIAEMLRANSLYNSSFFEGDAANIKPIPKQVVTQGVVGYNDKFGDK